MTANDDERWNSNEYRYCPNIHKNFSISNVSSLIYFSRLFAILLGLLSHSPALRQQTSYVQHAHWSDFFLSAENVECSRTLRIQSSHKFFFPSYTHSRYRSATGPSLSGPSKQSSVYCVDGTHWVFKFLEFLVFFLFLSLSCSSRFSRVSVFYRIDALTLTSLGANVRRVLEFFFTVLGGWTRVLETHRRSLAASQSATTWENL